MDNLEKKKGRQVKSLKLLLKKDPLVKYNFHQYLDDKEDVLVVAHLKNNYVVGGYTQ